MCSRPGWFYMIACNFTLVYMSEASLGILHNYALVVASLKHHGNAYNANSLRSQRNSGANALLEGPRREKTTEGSTVSLIS